MYIYIYIYTHIDTHMCVYIYIYTYTYIYLYTYKGDGEAPADVGGRPPQLREVLHHQRPAAGGRSSRGLKQAIQHMIIK